MSVGVIRDHCKQRLMAQQYACCNAQRQTWRVRQPAGRHHFRSEQMASHQTRAIVGARKPLPAFPAVHELIVEVLIDGKDGAPKPGPNDRVRLHYACLIASSGGCVDSSRSKQFSDRGPYEVQLGVGQVVSGLELGVRALKLGAVARLHVPSRLAYGEHAAGVIPPHSALVFEVELLSINQCSALPTPAHLLRRLLLLPPTPSLCEMGAAGASATGFSSSDVQPRIIHASTEGLDESPPDPIGCHTDASGTVDPDAAPETGDPDAAAEAAATLPPMVGTALPVWLTRLRSVVPLPTPEGASFFAFLESAGRWTRAAGDAALRMLPGATPIRRVPYGTPWDSTTPLVLTGVREGWPALDWGWGFWEGQYGDRMVLCKQRAPMFDSDQSGAALMAEVTLREALQYARTAHLSPAGRDGEVPIMYMNGWDVFEALPELWDESIGELAGVQNKTAAEYCRLFKQFGMEGDQSLDKRMRQLCKLFVGPQAAITRMHQDNHHAHAWLTNLRGRKLYILCAPDEDASLIAPAGRSSQDGGSTREARLDPLNSTQRAARSSLTLHAVVLGPGETILAPNGWWHYAVCLEPTITLMCNFWDDANLHGLHDCFYDQAARSLDSTRKKVIDDHRGGRPTGTCKIPPTVVADPAASLVQFPHPREYVVVNRPWVYLREQPTTDAGMLAIRRPGTVVTFSAELDGWLRTAETVSKGRHGWALEDGAKLGLGVLLVPKPVG